MTGSTDNLFRNIETKHPTVELSRSRSTPVVVVNDRPKNQSTSNQNEFVQHLTATGYQETLILITPDHHTPLQAMSVVSPL